MSNALLTFSLRDAVRTAVIAAWGSIPISYGKPRMPIATTPYAVVQAGKVAISFDGPAATVTNTSQENSFTIIGRFPFPTDPTQVIEDQKVTLANALIAQLQASGGFAGVGMAPLVGAVEWSEGDDPNEKVFEVTLQFRVMTQATHH